MFEKPTTIMKTIAGSRLYGTNTANSDTDFKAVHLPTARDILLRPKRDVVVSASSGGAQANTAEDVDVESFELQRYLKLASDMQTIPVEMLFVNPQEKSRTWDQVIENRDRILSRNTKAFVGYCKGQAVRYSLRGKRLDTFKAVLAELYRYADINPKVSILIPELEGIEGVKIINKPQPGDVTIPYLDVYGRQAPATISVKEAMKVYLKPVEEAGRRANLAQEANGADWKSLYHAVRIAEQGVKLFKYGHIDFPVQNISLLMRIRNGEMEMDAVLDYFDAKATELEEIGDNSPLREKPDLEWIDNFVCTTHEQIVKKGSWRL